jgi:ankyrin repeat protein
MAAGANLLARSHTGETALHFAVNTYKLASINSLIRDHNEVFIDSTDGNGKTALHTAALMGNRPEILETLIAAHANVEARDRNGNTALHIAARGNPRCLRALLSSPDIDVNAVNSDGDTGLHIAVINQDEECVQQLIEAQANLKAKGAWGDTALHKAVYRHNTAIVEKLILADQTLLELTNDRKLTALHIAASNESIPILAALIDNGANLNTKNSNGQTALHISISNRYKKCALKLIQSRGCSLNDLDDKGFTPFHLAVMSGHIEIVKALIEAGADIGIQHREFNPVELTSNDEIRQLILAAQQPQ